MSVVEREIFTPEQADLKCYFRDKVCDGTYWNYSACSSHIDGWRVKPDHAIHDTCGICYLFPKEDTK